MHTKTSMVTTNREVVDNKVFVTCYQFSNLLSLVFNTDVDSKPKTSVVSTEELVKTIVASDHKVETKAKQDIEEGLPELDSQTDIGNEDKPEDLAEAQPIAEEDQSRDNELSGVGHHNPLSSPSTSSSPSSSAYALVLVPQEAKVGDRSEHKCVKWPIIICHY